MPIWFTGLLPRLELIDGEYGDDGEVQAVMLSTSPVGVGLSTFLDSGWIIPALLVLIVVGQ